MSQLKHTSQRTFHEIEGKSDETNFRTETEIGPHRGNVMSYPKKETFEHDGRNFEIVTSAEGTRFTVVVYLNDSIVSPEYSVDIHTNKNYFDSHKESLVDHLVDIAKSDVIEGMYFRG